MGCPLLAWVFKILKIFRGDLVITCPLHSHLVPLRLVCSQNIDYGQACSSYGITLHWCSSLHFCSACLCCSQLSQLQQLNLTANPVQQHKAYHMVLTALAHLTQLDGQPHAEQPLANNLNAGLLQAGATLWHSDGAGEQQQACWTSRNCKASNCAGSAYPSAPSRSRHHAELTVGLS